jgi:uncharacterized protein
MAPDKERCLLVMVRAPIRGRVKSRMALSLDEEIVLDLYRAFVLDTLATASALLIPVVVCFEPADATDEVARWLGDGFTYLAQKGEDLGQRMENAFRHLFSEGYQCAVLVGSDTPDLPEELIREAFVSLKQKDAVIGPARDGGYYLIGFKGDRLLPEVFQDIPWGEDCVFPRTMDFFRKHLYDVHILAEWHDMDRVEDLGHLMGKTGQGPGERTRDCLARHREAIERAGVVKLGPEDHED